MLGLLEGLMSLMGRENWGPRLRSSADDGHDGTRTNHEVETNGKKALIEIRVLDDAQRPLSLGSIRTRPTPEGFVFNNPKRVSNEFKDYNPRSSRVLTFSLHPMEEERVDDMGVRARSFLNNIDPERRKGKLFDALVEAILELITKDDKTFYIINPVVSNIKETRAGERKKRSNEAIEYHLLFKNACVEAFGRCREKYPKSPVRLIIDL